MFWEKFIALCASSGESPNKVAEKIGITSGSVTGWKNGGIPRLSTLKKIADYFGISVEYLRDDSDIKDPAAYKSSGVEKEVIRLFQNVPDDKKPEVMRYLQFLSQIEKEDINE